MRIYPGTTVDYEFKQLRSLGYSGALNDMQFAALRAEDLENALPDMFNQFDGDIGGSGLYTARFGVGADNATGTGAFDTSLYTGDTPADGTYGNFSVTSGVITPNGSQTVGTYDVGGWPVEVINGYKAIANQTEMNAVTPANSSGKTVLVREAAALTVPNTWNSGGDFNWATILGDGDDPRLDFSAGKDSRKHFVTWWTVSLKKMIFRNLRVVPGSVAGAWVDAFIFTQSGTATEDIQIVNCAVVASRPDPFGDYTLGEVSYPGAKAIFFQGTTRRVSVRDNIVYGGGAGNVGVPASIQCEPVSEWCEVVGNWVDLFYIDAIRGPTDAATNFILGGNLVTRPASKSTDATGPHSDGVQWTTGGRGVCEANAFVLGETRGEWQAFFAADGVTSLTVRNTVVADTALYQISVFDPNGGTIQNCTWLPKAGVGFPLVNPQGGIRNSGILVGTNDIVDSVFRLSSSIIDGGITQTGNVNAQTWVEADWDTNFPNWEISGLPTLQNVFQLHAVPSGGGAAAGKGASQNITSWGAERSSYVLNYTTPTVSNITLTPTSDGFTGTLRTNVGNNGVYYAVIPQAQGNPTWREIKERRVPNAAGYGSLWCSRANAGTDLAISITSASPSTAYKLCVVAENGWSVQSAITTANFTTIAAGIQRIAVGAAAHAVATSINVPIPSAGVVNGDYLVMFVVHRDTDGELNAISGWTKIGDGDGWSSGSPEVEVYGRVRDGTEGATVTVTAIASFQLIGACAAYRGTSGVGVTATNKAFSTTSHGTPTLTATAESCILHVWSTTAIPLTLPNAGDLVVKQAGGSQFSLGVEDQLSVSAGVTTSRTGTAGGTVTWNAMQIELLKA